MTRGDVSRAEWMEGDMILELALTYLPVLVVGLFWALAMRPLLRLTHLSPFAAPGHLRRSRPPRRG